MTEGTWSLCGQVETTLEASLTLPQSRSAQLLPLLAQGSSRQQQRRAGGAGSTRQRWPESCFKEKRVCRAVSLQKEIWVAPGGKEPDEICSRTEQEQTEPWPCTPLPHPRAQPTPSAVWDPFLGRESCSQCCSRSWGTARTITTSFPSQRQEPARFRTQKIKIIPFWSSAVHLSGCAKRCELLGALQGWAGGSCSIF